MYSSRARLSIGVPFFVVRIFVVPSLTCLFLYQLLLFSMSFESVSSGPLNIPWPLPASKLESPSLQLFTASEPVRRSLGSIVVVYGLRLNGYSCRNEYKRWVFFA